MNKKEAQRINAQEATLTGLGFTLDEAEALRRISMTLHRWHERECGDGNSCVVRGRMNGGDFEYDDDGDAYEEYAGASGRNRYHRVPDRERGAKKRLAAIIEARNARDYHPIIKGNLTAYIQTDPRGCALYILRPGDVPAGEDADAYYNRGVAVY